jgi:hypothetical protein
MGLDLSTRSDNGTVPSFLSDSVDLLQKFFVLQY